MFSNVAEGIHSGGLTRALDNEVATRYLLATVGAAADTVDICGESEVPLGVMTDTGAAGDLVNVALPGNTATTLLLVAAGAITVGADVFTAAGGKVQAQPTTAKSLYHIGRAVTAAQNANELIEVIPLVPTKVTVMAAFTGSAATDVAALEVVLQGGPDRVVVLSS